MPAFWEDGRLMSKGHLLVPRMDRRFYRYIRNIKASGAAQAGQKADITSWGLVSFTVLASPDAGPDMATVAWGFMPL